MEEAYLPSHLQYLPKILGLRIPIFFGFAVVVAVLKLLITDKIVSGIGFISIYFLLFIVSHYFERNILKLYLKKSEILKWEGEISRISK